MRLFTKIIKINWNNVKDLVNIEMQFDEDLTIYKINITKNQFNNLKILPSIKYCKIT
jgi:hypothetical protein